MPTTPIHPDRIELHHRLYVQLRAQRVAIWATVALLALMTIGILAALAYLATRAGGDPAAVLDSLRARFADRPWDTGAHLLLVVVVVGQLLYMRRAQRHERVILTSAGIEYRSPLPAALQFLRPGWSLAWGQIRSARLKNTLGGRGPQTVVLELDGGTRKVKLYPWQWVDPQQHQPQSVWQQARQWQRAAPEAVSAAIYDTAILRRLAAARPHLAPRPDAPLTAAAFALEKNPHSLALVAAFFVLVLYAIADAAIGPETYAAAAPLPAFATLGVLAALAAALWMRRGRVPPAETAIVALLVGGALAAASYPGALRLNALTDTDGLRRYPYQLTRAGQLEPLTPGPPTLAFPHDYEYWQQFPPGSQHEFELRKGGLGFYQLNLQPLNEALRAFYTTHAPRPAASTPTTNNRQLFLPPTPKNPIAPSNHHPHPITKPTPL